MSKYENDYGLVVMWCNDCGEETTEPDCCIDGEVLHYDDCDCSDCEWQ